MDRKFRRSVYLPPLDIVIYDVVNVRFAGTSTSRQCIHKWGGSCWSGRWARGRHRSRRHQSADVIAAGRHDRTRAIEEEEDTHGIGRRLPSTHWATVHSRSICRCRCHPPVRRPAVSARRVSEKPCPPCRWPEMRFREPWFILLNSKLNLQNIIYCIWRVVSEKKIEKILFFITYTRMCLFFGIFIQQNYNKICFINFF